VLVAARSGGDDDFAPLPGTRYEVAALARLFKSDDRLTRTLVGLGASAQELERLAASGDLGRYGFIHLATHGVIDEDLPTRSAVILTQTGLPDPLEQVLNHKPVFDGRLSVREIQHGWDLKAELVTLSACETALGRQVGGEGFVGFTQALLMSGARSVGLSMWKVDDTATAILMQRFYANLLGRRSEFTAPMPKAEALREAKAWLRGLSRSDALAATATLSGGIERGKGSKARQSAELSAAVPAGGDDDRPYAAPHFWAAFISQMIRIDRRPGHLEALPRLEILSLNPTPITDAGLVHTLHRRGWSQRRIAAELGIVRETVAPENDMAEMRVQGARKKRWHGI
jgi:CHAT domain-containing protein